MMNRYGKWIVLLVIVMNIGFLPYVKSVMLALGSEPETLIKAWFSFTGVELLALAGIRISEVVKGGSEDDTDRSKYKV